MTDSTPYRVLARKYRPQNFDELIGQDVLVRTLTNAINGGRVAQAFMLTGIRGTGKTTTARIIAKALNYKDAPTAGSTDDCSICQAIAQGNHPDVIEMDAASSSKVEEMRDLLDGVPYAPIEARIKVYIIDEVHMLSKNAFNALLKTLEEPPAHVKFIFATTEIRKVPVTVLSRCQRFDLHRVSKEDLSKYYLEICEKEGVEASDEAIALIANAADGSVRDGLSLLDQAMAQGGDNITLESVQNMLGLMDGGRVEATLTAALTGDVKGALSKMDEFYMLGADPALVVEDMLSIVHGWTRNKTIDKDGDFSMPTLGQAWQILSSGLVEIHNASNARMAADMLIMRLAYAADLPDPKDLLKKLNSNEISAPTTITQPSGGSGGVSGNAALAVQQKQTTQITCAQDLVEVLREGGQQILAQNVYMFLRPSRFSSGQIHAQFADGAPATMASDIGKALGEITGTRWVVVLTSDEVQLSLSELQKVKMDKALDRARQDPLVQSVIKHFPNARLEGIKE